MRRTLVLLALGLGSLAGAGWWAWAARPKGPDSFIPALAQLAASYRPLAARITGGFSHSPCRVEPSDGKLVAGLVCGGGSPPPLAELTELAARARQMPLNDHDRGVFGLLWPALEGRVKNSLDALQRAAEEGFRQRRELDLGAATRSLEVALEHLTRAGSPLRHWAKYGLVRVWTDRHEPAAHERALALIREIQRETPPDHHLVRGFAARSEGLIYHRTGRYPQALRAYRQAIAEGEKSGHPELVVRVQSWLAELEAALRGSDAAWRDLYAALKLAPRFPDQPFSRSYVFELVAREAGLRDAGLALQFQGQAVEDAIRTGDPRLAADALVVRATIAARLGYTAGAEDDLARALRYASTVSNEAVRTALLADIDLASGLVRLRSDPARSAAALNRAIAVYQKNEYHLGLAQAHLYLANAYLAANRVDSAETEFLMALAEAERQRSALSSYQDRVQFLDYARPVFDRVVAFYANQGQIDRALKFSDAARARVLSSRSARAKGAWYDRQTWRRCSAT